MPRTACLSSSAWKICTLQPAGDQVQSTEGPDGTASCISSHLSLLSAGERSQQAALPCGCRTCRLSLTGCFCVRQTSHISRQVRLTQSSSKQVQTFDCRPCCHRCLSCAIWMQILKRWVRSQICHMLAGPEVTDDRAVEAAKSLLAGLQALALPAMVLRTCEKLPSMSEIVMETVGYLLGSTDVECLQRVSPLTGCQRIPARCKPLPPAGQHHSQSLHRMSLCSMASSVSSSCEPWPPAGQQHCRDLVAGEPSQCLPGSTTSKCTQRVAPGQVPAEQHRSALCGPLVLAGCNPVKPLSPAQSVSACRCPCQRADATILLLSVWQFAWAALSDRRGLLSTLATCHMSLAHAASQIHPCLAQHAYDVLFLICSGCPQWPVTCLLQNGLMPAVWLLSVCRWPAATAARQGATACCPTWYPKLIHQSNVTTPEVDPLCVQVARQHLQPDAAPACQQIWPHTCASCPLRPLPQPRRLSRHFCASRAASQR